MAADAPAADTSAGTPEADVAHFDVDLTSTLHFPALGALSAPAPSGEVVSVIPTGVWQAARSLGDYTLVGCTVGPGFEFADFEFVSALAVPPRPFRRRAGSIRYLAIMRFMTDETLRQLLARVHERLSSTSSLDPESREMLATVVRDINGALAKGSAQPDSFSAAAVSPEARVSANAPLV